ncbi:uncharacterized protein A4U43_C05F8760 [Asparagus officinalis]|uniref:APO domain-containing protein n=1 Tax=Asparagus officinalis TaxID=4686 RepID=A0A5P1EQA4_ASPOF|nr:uncharacterized protein A4U43_C05F8760 [Asparagus officinalis]
MESILLPQKGVCLGFVDTRRTKAHGFFKVGQQPFHYFEKTKTTSKAYACLSQEIDDPSTVKKYGKQRRQNVDLPPILPKNKKKPYPIPLKKIQRAARTDKKLAEKGIEKPLEPPKNGLLVPELIPVAYEVLESWKVLIKGLSQLLTVVPVHGCSNCPEVHVGPIGHRIQDCHGPGNVNPKPPRMGSRLHS